MPPMRLHPDDCHHCDVARRAARERYAEQGASEEWIKAAVSNTFCPKHQAQSEARQAREKRNQSDRQRRAKQRWR
jgi:hypothetical protein